MLSKELRSYALERSGWCGPRACQIAYDFFHIYPKQSQLAQELGTTEEQGTPLLNMVSHMRRHGLWVTHYQNADLDILERFVKDPRHVTIVNWWDNIRDGEDSPDSGHYSVPQGILEDHLWLVGEPKVRISDFLDRWWDNDYRNGEWNRYERNFLDITEPSYAKKKLLQFLPNLRKR